MEGDGGRAMVTPGTKLAAQSTHEAGDGTYLRDGFIYSSLLGQRKEEKSSEEEGKPVISVHRPNEIASLVPTVGTIVTCKVVSMNPRFAKTKILCVGAVPLQQSFSGMIRLQDIRSTERNKVAVYTSFRPGDIVLARVISLGDVRSYYLSTAERNLGVVSARSEAGHIMKTISLTEMECPHTKIREARKVALVVEEEEEEAGKRMDEGRDEAGDK